ncbi:MAG TPA: class I SAM-dependent methyltransferase [Solirubrobacteraceae bacterium]|nr:class I SAM-dependent methyltransferase [Solirubrobacteraceae bacterium]
MTLDVEGFKQGQRMMWSIGDYPDIARHIENVATGLADAVGVQPGHAVLDVATGSGNVALAAAQLGAEVTGLDLTPELLDAARARARETGLDVTWVEGDAESLPFDPDSFDRVTSCFGAMFAPRHTQAANELLRVCRPGGTIGICAWTPEGVNGEMFRLIGSFMPPPPPELQPPVLWGTETHMRQLLGRDGTQLEFERRNATFEYPSIEGWLEYGEQKLGPAMLAKRALEPQGRYEELRDQLLALYEGFNEATDGTLRFQGEYLLTVARLPGA